MLYGYLGLTATVNAASYAEGTAPDSLVSLFGLYENPATSVVIEDSNFIPVNATVLYSSTTQVNAFVPPSQPFGETYIVRLLGPAGLVGHGTAVVNRLAAGLFTANGAGTGLAAGDLQRISISNPNNYTFEPLSASGNELRPDTEYAYLVLYGTGIRLRTSLAQVTMTIDNVSVPVVYAGAQGAYLGLDQVNAGPLPATLKGRGMINIRLSVEGQIANIVQARFN
jgi:uncharacterized protein (TIGR03437 family)